MLDIVTYALAGWSPNSTDTWNHQCDNVLYTFSDFEKEYGTALDHEIIEISHWIKECMFYVMFTM